MGIMGKLKGKVAIVTGGASGLGRAVAILFSKEGAKVAVLDLNLEAAQKVVKEIESAGREALAVRCDVTQESQVKEAFNEVVKAYSRIDILHANAGIIDKPRFITEMSIEDWNKIISVNLTGMFLSAKYAVSQMLKQDGGTIVFTGSNWAFVCDPGFTSYAASKGGVVSFARALALDHAKDNIRINVICPGNIRSPLLDKQLSLEKDPTKALQSMGRISEPEEVANLVLFLASDESLAMKGSVIIIDQGETLQHGPGLQANCR
ncbi:SDR family oxidoreductase [Candidatus Aerophobetes bacterium]|nr:SDR family oxidoreductase [Candidatus Aerophobetes bacterium]